MAYKHEIYIASFDTAPAMEDGTIANPYCGTVTVGQTNAQNASRFDNLIKDTSKLPSGASVCLLPGVFYTNGHPGTNSGTPWKPSDNMRLRGSGMGATTLQLLPTSGGTRFAVGIDFQAAGTGLVGFELRDLTIDCGLGSSPATNTFAGAVRVRGTHILLERILVKNYGGSSSTASTVVPIVTAAGEGSENCVVSECSADPYADGHNCIATIFVFERDLAATPTHNGHRFCAIRNCAARGIATIDPPPPIIERVRAISPGPGLGTIIEGNQIANCAVGVHYNPPSADRPAKDLVVWNNYFRNVSIGIYFNNDSTAGAPTGPALGRLVLQDNIIEIATVTGSVSGGIWRNGILTTSQTATRFNQIAARKNLIRDVQTPVGNTAELYGLYLQRIAELIAENNVISNIAETGSGTGAVITENCGATKFFNNQDQGGKLLRGYNGTQRVLELEDAVQDVLLPI